jgi:hypothetical protein
MNFPASLEAEYEYKQDLTYILIAMLVSTSVSNESMKLTLLVNRLSPQESDLRRQYQRSVKTVLARAQYAVYPSPTYLASFFA